MKLIAIISIVLMITLVLFSWGSLINDFETNYVDTGISNTTKINESFKGTYDRKDEINKTFSPLRESFENMQKEDRGWFITSGITFFTGIIALPGIILTTMGYALTDMTTILNEIGIPPTVVLIAGTLFIIFILFKLVELWRRYEA